MNIRTKICFVMLMMNSYIQLFLSSIMEKMCATSVSISKNDVTYSVFLRYVAIYLLLIIKKYFIRSTNKLIEYIDVSADYIQVTKRINGNTIYFVRDVSSQKVCIEHMIKEVPYTCNIKLPQVIIRGINHIHNNKTTSIKDLIISYMVTIEDNIDLTIRTVMMLNNIDFSDNDVINIDIIKNKKRINVSKKIKDDKYLTISELCN